MTFVEPNAHAWVLCSYVSSFLLVSLNRVSVWLSSFFSCDGRLRRWLIILRFTNDDGRGRLFPVYQCFRYRSWPFYLQISGLCLFVPSFLAKRLMDTASRRLPGCALCNEILDFSFVIRVKGFLEADNDAGDGIDV